MLLIFVLATVWFLFYEVIWPEIKYDRKARLKLFAAVNLVEIYIPVCLQLSASLN